MSYSDGLALVPAAPTERQVEAVAADNDTIYLPYPCTILAFGALITETFAAHAVDPVLSLDFLNKDTARTEILAITINSALKRGDGSRAAFTALAADSDIVANDVVQYRGAALPKKLPAGTTLIVEHKTAAGEAGGAYRAQVLVRVDGYELAADEILS